MCIRDRPSASTVSLARRKEKTARLYEQGASTPTTTFVEVNQRIEQYQQNWLRYLQGILGIDHPATKTTSPPGTHSDTMPDPVLSFLHPSPSP